MADVSKDLPTIFRIDCIGELKMTKQHFNIHYNDKFNEREINKREQINKYNIYNNKREKTIRTNNINMNVIGKIFLFKCGTMYFVKATLNSFN